MVKLRQFLTEFPAHPILLQLIRICNRLSRLPATSPVMKILTGLELLLKKCEEWESYASKRVSLSEVLKPLSSLVARWRKMELHSWPRALDNVDRKHHTEALRWWFHLYGLVNVSHESMLALAGTTESDRHIFFYRSWCFYGAF